MNNEKWQMVNRGSKKYTVHSTQMVWEGLLGGGVETLVRVMVGAAEA